MATRDFYQILGVAADSEDVVIQAAYRALMRRYHPDTNNSADAGRRAIEINEAYEVLRDPVRRAQYDEELRSSRAESEANTKSRTSPPPPPPPPPPPQENDVRPAAGPPRPWDDLGTRIAVALIATFVIIVTVGAINENGSMAADNNMAVENLEAANLVVEDDYNAIEANVSAPDAIPSAPPTLATVSEAPVQYDDIESAASRFAQVLTKSGMAGARTLSEKCHSNVSTQPTWASADWCAAFDFAAAHVDAEVSRSAGLPASPYFQFQAENQADRYKEAGAADYFVNTRLSSIKEAAEAAADDAVMGEIAKLKSQASQDAAPEPSAPEQGQNLNQQWLDNVLSSQATNRAREHD